MATTPFKVLLAVDPSETAAAAAEYYYQFIHQPSYDVHVVYAAEPPKLKTLSFSAPLQPPVADWNEALQETNKQRTDLEDKFDKMKIGVDPKMKYAFECKLASKPGEAICQVADQSNVNLIVIGNRGLNKIRRTFMGSVSEYVLHHANCPVMVIPKGSTTNVAQK